MRLLDCRVKALESARDSSRIVCVAVGAGEGLSEAVAIFERKKGPVGRRVILPIDPLDEAI